jgi:molybdenum cofactor biosynthesis protein B
MPESSDQTVRAALDIAILTVSDTRTEATDGSGQALIDALQREGHRLAGRAIIPDDKYRIRATASAWIADATIDVVLISGGTGLTGRDGTPEAVRPLLDKEIEGFGELFRQISHREIGASALLSRALAGIANGTAIFCIPGSPSACRTAWNALIRDLLDSRVKPCNLAALRPRLRE